jgi:predicted ATP-dependent endonuclease of OLD family
MIIDEPELHLHPQLQKQYLEIIEQESKKRNIQFILITHSPVFVTEHTIGNVKRVYFSNNTSNVFIPKEISLDDSLLIRILSYTNNSKIFFVNKVILVEGAGDEYFLNYYISKAFPMAGNFEILNIGGKEEFPKWKEFLEKWGLQVYFIGDWDNVKNFGILSEAEYQNFKSISSQLNIKKISKTLSESNYRDGKKLLELVGLVIGDPSCLSKIYNDLVHAFNRVIEKHICCSDILKHLKNSNEDTLEVINKKIEQKYQDKVYILKHGELEDYLGLSKKNKGLKQVVDFCNKDCLDLIRAEFKEELDIILSNILIED